MRDSDWSRPNLLRSDWLGPSVALSTTVSFLECGSKCRVNKAEFRIALWCTWLVIYVCHLHILHPHRKKKCIKELSIILLTVP